MFASRFRQRIGWAIWRSSISVETAIASSFASCTSTEAFSDDVFHQTKQMVWTARRGQKIKPLIIAGVLQEQSGLKRAANRVSADVSIID